MALGILFVVLVVGVHIYAATAESRMMGAAVMMDVAFAYAFGSAYLLSRGVREVTVSDGFVRWEGSAGRVSVPLTSIRRCSWPRPTGRLVVEFDTGVEVALSIDAPGQAELVARAASESERPLTRTAGELARSGRGWWLFLIGCAVVGVGTAVFVQVELGTPAAALALVFPASVFAVFPVPSVRLTRDGIRLGHGRWQRMIPYATQEIVGIDRDRVTLRCRLTDAPTTVRTWPGDGWDVACRIREGRDAQR